MEKLHSASFQVGTLEKKIEVYCGDVTAFDEPIDVLTASAYLHSYAPTPRTVFKALYEKGIDARVLAESPAIDLRNPCRVWLSDEIPQSETQICRMGCIELLDYFHRDQDHEEFEESMIRSIRAYFHMLDVAAIYGIPVSTVALPLLGSGSQHISAKLLLIPLLNECISFLKRNQEAQRILFIEINPEKAQTIADCLLQSFRFMQSDEEEAKKRERTVFLSYASPDRNIADNLCFKLESAGVKVWYAPRNVVGPYAAAIANAVETATHFVVILSENSIRSEHVLNEIDLAFQKLPNTIKFKPLRIDTATFNPSFKYYLSRQHWMDATIPPLEDRLNEFVKALLAEEA